MIFFFKFILNLPWTMGGFVLGILSWPMKFSLNKNPFAVVIYTKRFWWRDLGYIKKGIRAITIGNTILFSIDVTPKNLQHELIHLEQYIKYPLVFPLLYILETHKSGYRNNKYEVEAYYRRVDNQ